MTKRTVLCWCLVAAFLLAGGPAAVVRAQGGATRAAVPRDSGGPDLAPAIEVEAPAPDPAGNVAASSAVSDGGGSSGLMAVMGVTLIIWLGLFLYVFGLDRKVRRLEGP